MLEILEISWSYGTCCSQRPPNDEVHSNAEVHFAHLKIDLETKVNFCYVLISSMVPEVLFVTRCRGRPQTQMGPSRFQTSSSRPWVRHRRTRLMAVRSCHERLVPRSHVQRVNASPRVSQHPTWSQRGPSWAIFHPAERPLCPKLGPQQHITTINLAGPGVSS
jgi:hypothetical protein